MGKTMKQLGIIFTLFALFTGALFAQSMKNLHGDQSYHRRGIHDGNRIRTSFGNDGQIGFRGNFASTTDLPGEWPINSNHVYLSKIMLLPMAEVRDINGIIQHIVSECHGTGTTKDFPLQASVGDLTAGGRWRTMTPLPGFINPALMSLPADQASPALSDQPDTWPDFWPDKLNDPIDPGWAGEWNGYFGKGKGNSPADQESYWVADDYWNDEFEFYPDENNLSRRGLGIRMYYRGLQWANPLVQDVMYTIYDVENIGSKTLDKVNFASLPDMDCGPVVGSYDGPSFPDGVVFDRVEDWFYSFDKIYVETGIGAFFTPIAYVGYALFESPGNEFDGIDNDNDGELNPEVGEGSGTGKRISEDDFSLGILDENRTIILIDYLTYKRTRTTLAALKQEKPEMFHGDTLIVDFIGRKYRFWPGKSLDEVWFNNFDDNLNGLIDENNGAQIGDEEFRYLYIDYVTGQGNLAVDYFSDDSSTNGMRNKLLDESRKDTIDNDGDWNPLLDDVGVDGLAGTGDYGENDGRPTSKYQYIGDSLIVHDGPGEPHIDAVDITESDMLGMTAFFWTQNWENYPLSDDQKLWNATIPGRVYGETDIYEIALMGSGYFPLPSGHIERFSGAYMFNNTVEGLKRTKVNAQRAYDANYQFYKAPERPTLHAVPGDKKVTLYWDDLAEYSVDPLTGQDFEGYRIYRSTGVDFKEMVPITNAFGDQKLMVPLVQFDLVNGIKGLSNSVLEGVQFYLGDDTGLQHEWVDTNVVNGQRYFYFITSYDHGDDAQGVAPTECNKKLLLDPQTGDVLVKSSNVAVVTPNAPSAGYVPAVEDIPVEHVDGFSNSTLGIQIFDSPAVKDGHTYRVTFKDTVKKLPSGGAPQLVTASVTLENITTGDILFKDSERGLKEDGKFPVTEGFILMLNNYPVVTIDTSRTKFERSGIYAPTFKTYYKRNSNYKGNIRPADYLIEFGEVGIDTSTAYRIDRTNLPSIPVNFTITNLTEGRKIDFAFNEKDFIFNDPSTRGMFTFNQSGLGFRDYIYFLEKDENGDLETTWMVYLFWSDNSADTTNPTAGDKLSMYTFKPFLSNDVLEFTTIGERIDKKQAAFEINRIKVVPNPYVVSNQWERQNPYSTGRGPRELHFTHLPPRCTIRIFDIAGQLIDTIERDVQTTIDGTAVWDMLTRDGLEIGFGVYIYHIEAPGIGEKIGKFAVIK